MGFLLSLKQCLVFVLSPPGFTDSFSFLALKTINHRHKYKQRKKQLSRCKGWSFSGDGLILVASVTIEIKSIFPSGYFYCLVNEEIFYSDFNSPLNHKENEVEEKG